MEIALVIARQLLVMFLYMSCGFVLSKKELVKEDGSKAIATLLIYLVIPAVVLRSFYTEQNPEKTVSLLISLALAALCLLIAIVIARLIFPRRPVEEFGTEFSNAGFLGIPLISATLGAENVFYVAGFVALLNILQWSYGQPRMGMKLGSAKALLLSPLLLSLVLGLLLYFFQLPLPGILEDCVSAVASCNSPLAMILLGIYLGQTRPAQIFADKGVWAVSGVRLVVIPLATLGVLTLIPVNGTLKMALFLVSAAPVGSNVAMYAQRAGLDHGSATGGVCLSTLLSVITMPLLTAVAALLWNYA